ITGSSSGPTRQHRGACASAVAVLVQRFDDRVLLGGLHELDRAEQRSGGEDDADECGDGDAHQGVLRRCGQLRGWITPSNGMLRLVPGTVKDQKPARLTTTHAAMTGAARTPSPAGREAPSIR